jgi:DNA (cytosine-5)-methyltransferase 1
MTHGSLFSGIGGFDLASEWMGWDNKFHCEWNEFGQKVLHHYWPNAELFTDITKSNFTKYANKIDILTGGFPCQPYSSAGKRLGKEDARHLWPEMLRAIREIQPRWVVGENVRGLTNWNGGLVFDEVQSDLEAQGYEVLPFLLPACAVNAPHRRDRIWFVAHSKNNGCNQRGQRVDKRQVNKFQDRNSLRNQFTTNGEEPNVAHSNSNGLNECNSNNEINTSERGLNALDDIDKSDGNGDAADTNGSRFKTFNNKESKLGTKNTTKTLSRNSIESIHSRNWWENFPTVSPICNGDDGLSDRLDNITFPKWRNESIKAGGNAIVPQVVYQIFKAIEQYELILQNA